MNGITDYIATLEKNSQEAIEFVGACTKEELAYTPEDKWSILGIMEHILLTERLILTFLMKRPDRVAETDEIVGYEKLNKLIVQFRARKIKAPEMLHPKGDIGSAAEFGEKFLKQRELLKNCIATGRIVIDNGIHKHPFLGEMTIRDWLNFIPLHARRHLDQAAELLAVIRKNNL
jgi:hypothetical protein